MHEHRTCWRQTSSQKFRTCSYRPTACSYERRFWLGYIFRPT